MATKLDDLVIDIDSPSGSTAEEIGKIAASLKTLTNIDVGKMSVAFREVRASIDSLLDGLDTKAIGKVSRLTNSIASLARATRAAAKTAGFKEAGVRLGEELTSGLDDEIKGSAEKITKAVADAVEDGAKVSQSNSPGAQLKREIAELANLEKQGLSTGDSAWDKQYRKVEAIKAQVSGLKAELKQALTAENQSSAIGSQLRSARENVESLKKAGFDFGDANFDDAYKRLQLLTKEVSSYKKELSGVQSASKAAPNFTDSVGGQLAKAKEQLKELEKSGLRAGDSEWDAQYRKVTALSAAVKELKSNLTQNPTVGVKSGSIGYQLEEAKKNLESLESVGYRVGDSVWDDQYERVVQLTNAVKAYKKEIESAFATNTTPQNTKTAKERLNDSNRTFKDYKQYYKDIAEEKSGGDLGSQNQFARSYKDIDKYVSAMAGASVAVNAFLSGLRKIAPVAKTVFTKLAQGAWSATKGFGNLVLKVSGVKAMANGIHSATKAVSGFVRSIGRIALYRAVRGIIKSITQDFTTGLNNLYQYSKGFSGAFMSSMDSISASMQYLKNSIAAAASPFVNALAPAVEFAVDKFVDLLNVANQVVSSLLGNDTWTKAVRVPKEYAAAADEATNSTNKAKKAAEEYKNALLGFDEITKLPEPNSSSSNGGSGSGNGKQGVDYSSMFTEEQVSTQTAGWAKMLKEAWESADLSDIGNIVGLKIKSGLDNIDWTGIQDKGRHIAKSVATLINGYLGTEGLDVSVGKTVGEAIYTGLTTIDTYYSTYKFGSLGTFLSNGVNSAVSTLSGKNINFGSVIARSINASIADIGSFAGNVHWSEIGTFIADNANRFFKDTNFKDAGKAAHDLVTGLGDMLSTAIDNIDAEEVAKSLKDFLDGLDPIDIVVNIGKIAFKLAGKVVDTVASLFGIGNEWGGSGGSFDVELNATKLNDKIPIKDKKVDGMTAGLDKHSKSSKFSNTISDMTASFSDRKKASNFSDSLSMTASFSKKTDNLKDTDKNLSGFKAVITSKSNSLTTNDKKLTGFKAVISSIVAKTKQIATWLGIKQAATGGIYKNGKWSGIAKYATGGMPNMGQLFIAREAGPELVGKMPGGGTAVMNNNQIVASVSAGVYKAVLAAMGSGGSGGNITVNLVLDGRVVSQTVVNQLRNQANRGEFPLAGMA